MKFTKILRPVKRSVRADYFMLDPELYWGKAEDGAWHGPFTSNPNARQKAQESPDAAIRRMRPDANDSDVEAIYQYWLANEEMALSFACKTWTGA